MWLRKKTQNLPTSCTSWRLNPHDQLGRLCSYGTYKRTLRAPTIENALVLTAVDTGGKNTQERDQIRIWAAPTAGPEISTVLEGIPGRWDGLWLPARERTLTAVIKKNILHYSYVLACSIGSFGFFPFFSRFVVVVNFIGTMKSCYAFELFFFFLSHTFYCCKPLPLGWAFAVLGSFPIFFFLIFQNLLLFFLHLFLCLLFLLFLSPCI